MFRNIFSLCLSNRYNTNTLLGRNFNRIFNSYFFRGVPRWVLLGDLNITAKNDDAKPAVYRIVRVHDHPNYKPPLYYNDISLFELNASVTMSPYVRPACLHTSTANLFNVKGSITGWGAVGHGTRYSYFAFSNSLTLIPHSQSTQ